MNTIHKDCFAYQNSSPKGCAVLNELYCKSEKCKFYKQSREGKYPRLMSEREKFMDKVRGIDL